MIIRQGDKKDIPGMMTLNNQLYSYQWKKEFYVWQCFENIHPVSFMVAIHDNTIIGMFGIQCRTLSNFSIRCGQISWINIHQDWQRKGIFAQLGKKAIAQSNHLDALCIFANDAAVGACKKSLDMTFIGKLNRMTLHMSTMNHTYDDAYTYETINQNTSFNTFCTNQELFLFDHSSGYRVWRFSQSPVYTYYKITISSGEYTIIKIFYNHANRISYGDIVDFECDLKETNKLFLLFSTTIYHLINKGISIATTWAIPNSILCSILKQIGFDISDHNNYFGMRVFNPEYQALTNFKQWHIVQSDATNY